VKVDREVFAVPDKTNFVFVEKIKAFKGSDASNVYDEEPADDELEFSDDEAEAAYRSRLKRK
jgi:H/ACA ribonucleoprotein complex non-core subunit NAF1